MMMNSGKMLMMLYMSHEERKNIKMASQAGVPRRRGVGWEAVRGGGSVWILAREPAPQ